MHFNTVYTFKTRRFTLELAVTPETDRPRDHFDDDATCYAIDQGVYEWFVARVRVLLDGREVSTEYMGGCCYEAVAQFRKDIYFHDMARDAIRAARQTLTNPPRLRDM